MPELEGVDVVWWRDWYDGPLDGLACYEGREYWFTAVGDWWNDRPRHYELVDVEESDLDREKALHDSGAMIPSGTSVAVDDGLFVDRPRVGTFRIG